MLRTDKEIEEDLKEKEKEKEFAELNQDLEERLKKVHILNKENIDAELEENIIFLLEKRHKELHDFLEVIKLLELENNNFKTIIETDLMELPKMLSYFDYDYFLILKTINQEIEIIKMKIKSIDAFDSVIIKFFKEEL